MNDVVKHFTPSHKTFAKKSILSANKFVTLRQVYPLYVRVNTFTEQIHFQRDITAQAFSIHYFEIVNAAKFSYVKGYFTYDYPTYLKSYYWHYQ